MSFYRPNHDIKGKGFHNVSINEEISMYESTLKIPVTKNDHIRGNIHSPVQLVEYADFECPYCGAAAPVMEELREKYKDSISIVFRHFPLTNQHPFAALAALASEAASLQNKFWEMHDALFDNQDYLSEETIQIIARELELDMRKFNHDLNDETLEDRVQLDYKGGLESGVQRTPSLFINGIKHVGRVTIKELSPEIDMLLEEQRPSPEA